MRRRYCDYMQNIQPSESFLFNLEREMKRELRKHSRSRRFPIKSFAAVCAAAAVFAVVMFGIRLTQPDRVDIVAPIALSPGRGTTVSQSTSVPDTSLPVMTTQPEAIEESIASAAPDSPKTTPSSTTGTESLLPPDDVRLDLEMSDEAVFAVSSIANQDWNHSVLMFEDYLAGSSTHGSHIVEICRSSERNSVVIAPLRPGTAYWPVRGSDNAKELTNEKGDVIGYVERVNYLDETTNTLKEGWRHVIYDAAPLPEVPDNPVESIQVPGKVKVGGTPLRYGKSAGAPVVAVLEEGQKLGLAYRVGNWIYASTEPFCANGETPSTGWIHISEVLGMQWRTTINHVDLTADEVNLRASPDGELIYTISKYDADNGLLSYGGATVPGKKGDWHFVTISFAWDDFVQTGYISADYSKLHTFRLKSELNMDGVISATLRYSDASPFGAAKQTVEGEKLSLLLERLKNAYSESVYTPVCGEGTASIILTYADGSSVELPLSGDSCTQVRFGDVTYDLKTDAERTERFLNDGGVGLSDILSPIFGEIKIP